MPKNNLSCPKIVLLPKNQGPAALRPTISYANVFTTKVQSLTQKRFSSLLGNIIWDIHDNFYVYACTPKISDRPIYFIDFHAL